MRGAVKEKDEAKFLTSFGRPDEPFPTLLASSANSFSSVSYTHLDVYKRQEYDNGPFGADSHYTACVNHDPDFNLYAALRKANV